MKKIILLLSDGEGKSADLLEIAGYNFGQERGMDVSAFPEGKSHPSFHGDAFDDFITNDLYKNDIALVTHSEVILMRALRRVAKGELTKDSLEIYQYLLPINSAPAPYWKEVSFDEEGELIDDFRGGIFEQAYKERFDIGDIKSL